MDFFFFFDTFSLERYRCDAKFLLYSAFESHLNRKDSSIVEMIVASLRAPYEFMNERRLSFVQLFSCPIYGVTIAVEKEKERHTQKHTRWLLNRFYLMWWCAKEIRRFSHRMSHQRFWTPKFARLVCLETSCLLHLNKFLICKLSHYFILTLHIATNCSGQKDCFLFFFVFWFLRRFTEIHGATFLDSFCEQIQFFSFHSSLCSSVYTQFICFLFVS